MCEAPGGFSFSPSVAGLRLMWALPNDDGGSRVTHLRGLRGTSSNGETFLTAVVPGDIGAQAYFDDAVTSGVQYYYMMSAVNAVGEGPLSVEASITAP